MLSSITLSILPYTEGSTQHNKVSKKEERRDEEERKKEKQSIGQE